MGLKKEGVSAKDYPHKSSNGEDSYTLVEFNHSTINSVKVTFDPSRITKPNTSGEYSQFKSLSKYPNFLRYSDLQDFVYKTKTENVISRNYFALGRCSSKSDGGRSHELKIQAFSA
uniref:Uncharacterized protein n=1 Tax=Candidatus Methanogaster sp. ANME-2c ERB4 TaxID=2759911 RepID=A0A7G9YH89_9EURY|nr:hypothetical protein LNGCCOLK_00051 [Methanosarcinales archaeon ANME-2c ERB4]